MKKYLNFIIAVFFLINSNQILGQSTENLKIENKLFEIAYESGNEKRIRTHKLKLDSISIKAIEYPTYISSKHKFRSSRTKLEINYFFNKEQLAAIYVIELSPKFHEKERLLCITKFYLKDRQIFNHSVEYTRPSSWSNRAAPIGFDYKTKFKYNKSLTTDFLKVYTIDILSRIKPSN